MLFLLPRSCPASRDFWLFPFQRIKKGEGEGRKCHAKTMMTNQAQVKLKSPACTAQANDINTNTYKVIPRWITRKQTRKINVLLCNFNFLSGGCQVGCGCQVLFRTVSRAPGKKKAREVRERSNAKERWAHALGGGRYFSSNLAPSPRPLLAPSHGPLARFWRFEAR
jgi:hypothetical protein